MPSLSLSAILLLTACGGGSAGHFFAQDTQDLTPKARIADYRMAQCETLWRINAREAVENALYWLRGMDCAGRLTPSQARKEAQLATGSGWVVAFKQGILLDNAGITPGERRLMLENINVYREDFPAALRPLLLSWRDRQTLFLSLSDERLRYKRLQESTDTQLETLQTQQGELQLQLEKTRQKLENLTDIERKLSARKQLSGEMPDNESERRNNVRGENDSPRGATVSKWHEEPTKTDQIYTPPAEQGTGGSTMKEPKK